MKATNEIVSGKALKVINVGLEVFYQSLVSQGLEPVHVDWQPPAAGDERLARLLERLA
jgi:hypothetical protein